MTSKFEKLRSSLFLKAAKKLHNRMVFGPDSGESPFCCDCIWEAGYAFDEDGDEEAFFKSVFNPNGKRHSLGWWEYGEAKDNYAGHDYESRLIALLLCRAIIMEERKNERT